MSEQQKHSTLERVLAYASVAIIAIAVLSYLTTLIVAMVAGREILAEGLWQLVTAISYVGLPIGFLALIALLGMNFARRGRER
jgi:ABC-type multidrug transport system permease subunit